MFGKILLTVVVVVFVWSGFKYLARMAELRQRRDGAPPPSPRPSAHGPQAEAETMVECRVCGTWQPARKARSCGRPDCPY
jgi:hypothetical protein